VVEICVRDHCSIRDGLLHCSIRDGLLGLVRTTLHYRRKNCLPLLTILLLVIAVIDVAYFISIFIISLILCFCMCCSTCLYKFNNNINIWVCTRNLSPVIGLDVQS